MTYPYNVFHTYKTHKTKPLYRKCINFHTNFQFPPQRKTKTNKLNMFCKLRFGIPNSIRFCSKTHTYFKNALQLVFPYNIIQNVHHVLPHTKKYSWYSFVLLTFHICQVLTEFSIVSAQDLAMISFFFFFFKRSHYILMHI